MKQKFVAIRNSAEGQPLTLYFLDIIQDSYDFWFGMNQSKVQEIVDQVNAAKPTSIKLVIDSEGGDAATGLAIYNFLKSLKIEVETEIIGLAGSIASVLAFAASPGKLKIARNAFMMIHQAWGGIAGNGDELRKYADLVDKFTNQIVDVYAQRTGKTFDAIKALIANGDYWMTGQEAVNQGFADATINDNAGFKVAARLQNGLNENYRNVPAFLLNQSCNPFSHFQNQFDDMKKFVLDLFNAMKGVKPAADDTPEAINNLVAQATEAPLAALADEIDNTISNRMSEAMKPFNLADGKTLNGIIDGLNIQMSALAKKNSELEEEISNLKGGATGDRKPAADGPKAIGGFIDKD